MINQKDLRIDTITNSSRFVQMRITHMPSGISIAGMSDEGRVRLRERLMQELEKLVKTQNGGRYVGA